MVAGNLDTTNLLLGVMAVVSVLEALVLVVCAVVSYRLYTRTMQTVRELEQRQIAPLAASVSALMTKVDDILADVKAITGRITERTERVDSAIQTTLDRVDETAGRVRRSVAWRVHQVRAVVHGARSAIESLFDNRGRNS